MRGLLLVLVIVLAILVLAGPGYLLGKCYLEKNAELRRYTEETTAYRAEIDRLQQEQHELRRALQHHEEVSTACTTTIDELRKTDQRVKALLHTECALR
jgi:chromosome segregation ATPase